jgi:hypothetical protein
MVVASMMSRNEPSAHNFQARGRVVRVHKNPISKYNYVMLCHNTNYNRVSTHSLPLLPRSRIYERCFPLLRLKYCVALILLGLCPLLNLCGCLLLLFLWLHYERAGVVVRANARLVPNPFARMVYYPDLCEHFGVMNKFLSLRLEYFLTLDIQVELTSRTSDGFVHFMAYNDAFVAQYSMFSRFRWLHLVQLVQMSVMSALSYYYIYLLWPN